MDLMFSAVVLENKIYTTHNFFHSFQIIFLLMGIGSLFEQGCFVPVEIGSGEDEDDYDDDKQILFRKSHLSL